MNLSFLLTLLSFTNPVFHNLLTGILSLAYINELLNQDYFYRKWKYMAIDKNPVFHDDYKFLFLLIFNKFPNYTH